METITCEIGLKATGEGYGRDTLISITSPKTGKTITLNKGYSAELPRRIVGKIAAAKSMGRRTAQFTIEELKAVAEVHQKMVDACRPIARGFTRVYRGFSGGGR